MAEEAFVPQHTDEEQATIAAALERNASIPPLRDENGDVVHPELKDLYAQMVECDAVIEAARVRKRELRARIVAIEEADTEARRTGVSVRLG